MARCNCGAQTCSCVLREGENITITGAGTARDPWVISAAGGEGGESGWGAGDRKETYRTDTQAGWLECNGQAVSRSTYAALFGAVGTRFGAGDGVNTFNLPNERGRTTVGVGAGYPQDQTGGADSTILSVENLPPHTHSINHNHAAVNTSSAGVHNHDLFRSDPLGGASTIPEGGAALPGQPSAGGVSSDGAHTHSVDLPAFTGVSGSTGASASFTNLPPYRAMRVLIKT